MTVESAKKHLRAMLTDFTPGSILHLLAEVLVEADDPVQGEQRQVVEKALFVIGLGVDAVLHRQ